MMFLVRASTTAATNTTATRMNSQRAKAESDSSPKAAPLLWMFTSDSTPGISVLLPVSSARETVTEYLTA